jgi:hypothetical protein
VLETNLVFFFVASLVSTKAPTGGFWPKSANDLCALYYLAIILYICFTSMVVIGPPMAELFDIYLSRQINEAAAAQAIALDPNAQALHEMAERLGTKLPSTPDVLLREPHELVAPPDTPHDLLVVPIIEHGILDEELLTASVASALIALRNEQDRVRLEKPSFWVGVGAMAVGITGAALSRNWGPLWVGGTGFATATGFMLYANRWRDVTPPDTSGYAAPIAVTFPA